MKIERLNHIKQSEIVLSPEFFKDNDVVPRKAIFHYGQWKKEVDIKTDSTMRPDRIRLSEVLLSEFTLPDSCTYDLLWDGRNLRLGPVIGFVTISKTDKLLENLDLFAGYFVNHAHFQGLIYICAIDGIDTSTKTIKGFYYEPNHSESYKGSSVESSSDESSSYEGSSGKVSEWKKGVFPYPGSMYRKTGFSRQLYEELIGEMGDAIFNTYFFNKWELWSWLSPSEECRKYLPNTRKLKDFLDIKEMLDLYGEVYLKKINSHKAKGIIKVKKDGEDYKFMYRLKGEKKFDNTDDINRFITEINKNKDYLVQQAIPMKNHEDRNFDFRVIMQKNSKGKWICNGNIARFGKEHSIATNFLLAGYALTGNDALKAVFNYSERDAFAKEQEMIQACTYLCETLDACAGNYGDLGVDVIVDENQKIWILEVNKLHDHKYPLYALNDQQMYYKVTTTPFEYASYLAGF